MTTTHGKDGIVKIGANAVAETQSWSITENAAISEAPAMGESWTKHNTGLKSASGNFSCHWDPSDTNGQVALAVGDEVSLNLYPSTDSVGAEEISLQATITSISRNGSVEGLISRSYDFVANGAVTTGTVSV